MDRLQIEEIVLTGKMMTENAVKNYLPTVAMTNYTKETMDALKEAVFNLSQADDDISVEEAKSEIAKVNALKDALVMKKTALVADDFASLSAPLRLVKVLKMPLMATCLVYGIHHGAEAMLVNQQQWS